MMLLQIISTTVWVWFERNSFGLTVPSFMKIYPQFIVSGSLDGSLILWHTQTGTLFRKLCGESFGAGYNSMQVAACRYKKH